MTISLYNVSKTPERKRDGHQQQEQRRKKDHLNKSFSLNSYTISLGLHITIDNFAVFCNSQWTFAVKINEKKYEKNTKTKFEW